MVCTSKCLFRHTCDSCCCHIQIGNVLLGVTHDKISFYAAAKRTNNSGRVVKQALTVNICASSFRVKQLPQRACKYRRICTKQHQVTSRFNDDCPVCGAEIEQGLFPLTWHELIPPSFLPNCFRGLMQELTSWVTLDPVRISKMKKISCHVLHQRTLRKLSALMIAVYFWDGLGSAVAKEAWRTTFDQSLGAESKRNAASATSAHNTEASPRMRQWLHSGKKMNRDVNRVHFALSIAEEMGRQSEGQKKAKSVGATYPLYRRRLATGAKYRTYHLQDKKSGHLDVRAAHGV